MEPRMTAVILAGGKGRRMQSNTPKQYLPLCGKPVLFYSLRAFSNSAVDSIVLVVGEGEEEYCKKEIVEKYGFSKVTHIVTGGTERYHSVYNGLLAAKKADYVLIHDGARPFITEAIIKKAMNLVKEKKACVVGVPVKDTIQIVSATDEITETPNRNLTWAAHTPQCFAYPIALQAYQKAIEADDDTVTDDAMVVRKYSNVPVFMMEGDYNNIKITTPDDIKTAELWIDFFDKPS